MVYSMPSKSPSRTKLLHILNFLIAFARLRSFPSQTRKKVFSGRGFGVPHILNIPSHVRSLGRANAALYMPPTLARWKLARRGLDTLPTRRSRWTTSSPRSRSACPRCGTNTHTTTISHYDTHAHTHIHTHIRAHRHTHTHTRTHAHLHTCTTRTCTHAHTPAHLTVAFPSG